MTRNALVLACLIGTIGAIYLTTLRQGHDWRSGDFSLYIAHARNLAEGRPYADTGYVYNPDNPTLSPRMYPPIFPLLLVPVYLIWGMNLTAMKVWIVLLFLALLGVLALLFSKRLPFPYAVGCLTLFALNPFVWQHKDLVLSEIPFMLFAYLALVLAEKAQQEATRRGALFWGLATGMAAYLAFGTRPNGGVLIPSFLICDWLRRRRLGTASLAITAAFLAGVATQMKWLPAADRTYLDQLVFDPALYVRPAVEKMQALAYFLKNGYSIAAGLVLFVCLLVPACWAYWTHLRPARGGTPGSASSGGLTACELFAFFYVLVLILWPATGSSPRYLMPILPLFFLWVAEGLHRLNATSFSRLEKPIAAALALAVLLSYAGWYSRIDFGPIRESVDAPEALELYDWVREQTDPHDVFLFLKPRIFALYTGRRALAHDPADDAPRLACTLRKYAVTYVLMYYSSPLPFFQEDNRLVETLIADNPSSFEKVYENRDFRVYRFREGALTSG